MASLPKPKKPISERNAPLALDPDAASALTALLAVRDGLATETQVEDAVKDQLKRTGEGLVRPMLAKVLVERGVLDEKTVKALEKRLDPEILPGYRILAEAGRGGMGTVFKARQLSMDRVVALKILANRLSADERYVEKFLAEARSAGKLNHENIVSAIDCGAAAGFHYFVMEFVDGAPVSDLLKKEGALPWQRAFEIAESVARALDHAHASGLVHRDVKPENILLAKTASTSGPEQFRVKLCDLGLAKEAVAAGTGEKSKVAEGTPYYCSPEQALGRTDIDARSDVYSLGATLYHLIANEPPFDGDGARAILWKQVHKPFPDLAQKLPQVPQGFRDIIARMVEKDREKRMPSVRAFLDAVAEEKQKALDLSRRPVQHAQKPARTVVLAVTFILIMGVLGASAVFLMKMLAGQQVVKDDGNKGTVKLDTVAATPSPSTKIERVTPPDSGTSTDPVPTPVPTAAATGGSDDEGAASAKAAQLLFDKATQFHDESPNDMAGYQEKLRAVVDRYPGTPAAVLAAKELATLSSVEVQEVDKAIEAARTTARELVAKGKWKDAALTLDGLGEKYDARVLAPRKDKLEKWRSAIAEDAHLRIADLTAQGNAKLAKGESTDEVCGALRALDADLPTPALQKEAKDAAQDLETRCATAIADGILAEVVSKRDDLLYQGKLDEGGALLSDLPNDARLAVRKDRVAALQAEQSDLVAAWHAFDEHVKALLQEAKHAFRRKTGSALEGQLKDYDGVAWSGHLKPYGQTRTVPLDLRDLAAEELIRFALPPGDASDSALAKELRGAALLFLARHLPEIATAALDRRVAAGSPDDPDLRARIAAERGRDRDLRALALVQKALNPSNLSSAPEEVVTSVRALAESYRDTKAYRDNFADLKKVYVPARTAHLNGPDIAHLFSGRYTKVLKDTVKLEYDFAKDEGSLHDWVPDKAIAPVVTPTVSKGRMMIRGKVRNCAVWEGGSLTFDARVITPSHDKPNVNLIVSDQGGWKGLLVGFGYCSQDLTRMRIDPNLNPKGRGLTIELPANVAYELDGKPPTQNGKCVSADKDPSAAVGRALHYIVSRDAKGGLKGQMGSTYAIILDSAPYFDQSGTCSIAGFETELAIEHVELKGRLETAWVADRARLVAETEANQFPKP